MITIRNNSICYDGLSTDEKPSKVYNGSIFNEIDTGKRFIFDEVNSRWLSYDKQPTPTKTSELENDSGFITAEDIPPVPTKTSELQNDSGFITLADLPIYNGGVL